MEHALRSRSNSREVRGEQQTPFSHPQQCSLRLLMRLYAAELMEALDI
jgi:hypothetical protein